MARKVVKLARKITEPWSRRWGAILSLVLAVGAGMVFIQNVLAVHDTLLFQLDGDAKSGDHLVQYPIFQPPYAVDDWDHVCYQVAINGGASANDAQTLCGTTTGTLASATGVSWVIDPITGDDHTTFVGGGSKDPNDISDWAADTGS